MRNRNGQEYFAPEVTGVMVAGYPAPIRNWISRHGDLTQSPIFLRGWKLMALYPFHRWWTVGRCK
jgi:hypothetical protein